MTNEEILQKHVPFDYETIDTKIDFLYRHRELKGGLYYPDELYKLFKQQ